MCEECRGTILLYNLLCCLSEGVNLIISIQSMFLQLTTIFRTFILVKGTGTLNCIFVSPTNIM